MGLGKTLQVLALIAHARTERPGEPPFLVVAPTSVVTAWADEAARHAPDLRVGVVRRGTDHVAEIAAGSDIVVTTYTLLRLAQDQYAAVGWSGLVLDEAQQVKNHQSKTYTAVRMIDAPFRLAVTGTPFENRLMEPVVAAVGDRARAVPVAAPLRRARRAPYRAGRRPDRARPLPRPGAAVPAAPHQGAWSPTTCRPSRSRCSPSTSPPATARSTTPTWPASGSGSSAWSRTSTATGSPSSARSPRCARLALDPALVDAEHDTVGSAKLDVLVDHLLEITAEGHRALVFSQFTSFLARVRTRLEAAGIRMTYLDGGTRDRAAVIDDFRAGTAPVFLISLKAGGVGLTLTEADYVFVLDPWWNPAAEAQAVDRAHRIGQTEHVHVYRLVATDTVEEKVMELKARKAESVRPGDRRRRRDEHLHRRRRHPRPLRRLSAASGNGRGRRRGRGATPTARFSSPAPKQEVRRCDRAAGWGRPPGRSGCDHHGRSMTGVRGEVRAGDPVLVTTQPVDVTPKVWLALPVTTPVPAS
ncbi:DEAD/DEAH box helicase [Nocardioides sp. W3-2-3]|nr:DEAD/DEAH box helicase [Nocardioides convexus]NHA00059.1 DEAD/DEAH box helicase [Nocardioides convexus]